MPAWLIQHLTSKKFVSQKFENTLNESDEYTSSLLDAMTFKKFEAAKRFKSHYKIEAEIVFLNIKHKQIMRPSQQYTMKKVVMPAIAI